MPRSSLKISVSLPERDVDLISQLKQSGAYRTTSAVIHAGLEKLREEELALQYAEAFEAAETQDWDSVEGDGWQ